MTNAARACYDTGAHPERRNLCILAPAILRRRRPMASDTIDRLTDKFRTNRERFEAFYYQNPAIVAEEALRSGDWTFYTETLARLWLGFENQELAAKFAAYIRECVEPEAYRSAVSSMGNED